jgi:hypothetical protein
MNEPWFTVAWAWLPGTIFGTLGGLWGSLVGVLAPQGRARKLVIGSGWAFFGVALVLLAGSLIGLATGQPVLVWYSLGLPGLLGVILFPTLLPVVYRRYQEAENRRMESQHL